MSKSIYIKIVSSLMAIFIIGSFSTFVNAADEESLYTRLGGTYNIALTVRSFS